MFYAETEVQKVEELFEDRQKYSFDSSMHTSTYEF